MAAITLKKIPSYLHMLVKIEQARRENKTGKKETLETIYLEMVSRGVETLTKKG